MAKQVVLSLLSPESEGGGLGADCGSRACMACSSSPPGGSVWRRCLVPAGASPRQRKGTV